MVEFVHKRDAGGASAKKGASAAEYFVELCKKNDLPIERCSKSEDCKHKDYRVTFPSVPTKRLPTGIRKVDSKATKSIRRGKESNENKFCLELRGTKGGGWILGNDDENFIAFHVQSQNLFYLIQVSELKSYLVHLHDSKIIDMNADAKVKKKGDMSDYEDFGVYRRNFPDKLREKFMYVPEEHVLNYCKYYILD